MSARWKSLGVAILTLSVSAMLPAATSTAGEETNPTFTKDIAPIFREKCEACHRPNSIAPMSLTTYEETRPWARSIKSRVETRQMPPWHMDKSIGIQEFKNDRSLSDQQIATIVRWIALGVPRGDPKDLPPPAEWPNEQGWNLAAQFAQTEPDLVIRSTPWTQEAGTNEAWWKPVVETGLTEPRWVRAIEIRPSTLEGWSITHHVIARLQQTETDPLAQNELGVSGEPQTGLFMEWAIGQPGEIMRPNSGRLMLPGSKIEWDIHYMGNGEAVTDSAELGIYFYPTGHTPEFREMLHLIGPADPDDVDIPPNVVKQTESFLVMKENGRIESMQPRMHLRGKAMSLEAILPNGQTQVLSRVNNFDFNWHITYQYGDDAAPLLPKGTRLKIVARHDNTSANKANPDPNVRVGYGDRAVDEMAHAWVNVTYMDDDDYKAELDARKEVLAKRTAESQP